MLADCTYVQISLFIKISKNTIASIKNDLRKVYSNYIDEHPVLLGGPGVVVEVDESVLCRWGSIRCPSTTDDNIRDTVWILGGIDNTTHRNFFVKRIENRQVNTLSSSMINHISIGSILHTDGYPSYPQVAENLGLSHSIVNNSAGFISADGIHTNNIEGFWAGLKSMMRKEHGVKRENLDLWLVEYTFKQRYLKGLDSETFDMRFQEILKLFFN